ncbi:TPA: tetratricopeptide repeat protein [Candidatus Poribacteria bacterium]|nr:tetratricopeptide repeat protein [Candidatus Poribacteria bacterium]
MLKSPKYTNLYVQKKAYFKAVEIYKLLLEGDPQNTTYWNSLGYAHIKMENFEQARQNFQTAVQIEPDNPSFHLNLSKTYHALGHKKSGVRIPNLPAAFLPTVVLKISPALPDAH